MTDVSDATDTMNESEGSGGEPEPPRQRRRYRQRFRLRRHRNLWHTHPGLMVLAAAFPAAILLFFLATDRGRPGAPQEGQPVATSSTVNQGVNLHRGHGVAAVFGPPLEQQSDGSGPERSPLPYLVVWIPILLVLEIIRREIRGRVEPGPASGASTEEASSGPL